MSEETTSSDTSPEARRAPFAAFHHVWTIAALVLAIVQLLLVQGINVLLLLVLLLPLGVALYLRYTSKDVLNRVLATVFLTLVDLGGFVKAFPRLFPDFKGFDMGLSPGNNRFLSWYLAILFAQLFCLNLLIIFMGQLILRARGHKTRYHPVTCYVGLSLGLVLSVGMAGAAVSAGLWPVWR